MEQILPAILSHPNDEKFITSRQCIQNVWRIAQDQPALRHMVISHLVDRFAECGFEKHANLLRLDVIQSLQKLNQGSSLDQTIADLIASEPDKKYRVTYTR